MKDEHEYVLGTGDDELARLGFQHELWSHAMHELLFRAKASPGNRILDVGCGPGFAALDMARLVGSSGRVVGIDASAGFVSHVQQQAKQRGLSHLSAVVGDVEALDEHVKGPFDIAYARWVLCFLAHPEKVLSSLSSVMGAGGRILLQDYFNYESMTAAPRRASYTRVVQATSASWRAHGGDPDVMGRVPRLLAEYGFRVDHLAVHQRVGRPEDTIWHWADTWWRVYVPKLVAMGFLTQDEADAFFRDMEDMAQRPNDFIVLPPVYEIMATKV